MTRYQSSGFGCTPDGCQQPDGSFAPCICSRKKIQIKPDTRVFSPANMRTGNQVKGYKQLLSFYQDEGYTLRYTGGLVPDVYQQFTKNMGIFTNPTSKESPAPRPSSALPSKRRRSAFSSRWRAARPPTACPVAPCST